MLHFILFDIAVHLACLTKFKIFSSFPIKQLSKKMKTNKQTNSNQYAEEEFYKILKQVRKVLVLLSVPKY